MLALTGDLCAFRMAASGWIRRGFRLAIRRGNPY
jgi:hypothetical protein